MLSKHIHVGKHRCSPYLTGTFAARRSLSSPEILPRLAQLLLSVEADVVLNVAKLLTSVLKGSLCASLQQLQFGRIFALSALLRHNDIDTANAVVQLLQVD
eukprot:6177985-Pleurochrysis_carterae.AAC.11